ncbi:MAG TPA: dienelactone hydrolase family protein [Pseudomonadales bacterium]|nr:dienelactone hydrolase family protein [Pseudomonadales bacterium]HNB84631.1 dienelactone hydrolase family protein [Pseudomonadales bacterium]HNF74759.1 dienelactone hydrolase family protein [Pseudomonadales bacterium]
MATIPQLPGYAFHEQQFGDSALRFYRRGQGPGVIVMHEIPGITPQVQAFADRVADAGFTVCLPWLFGVPGAPLSGGYLFRSMLGACVRREFTAFALGKSSPIITPLRALARALHQELGGPGVGALGMCFTGGFALGMMLEPAVLAPVLSQPSLPFPITERRKGAIDIDPVSLSQVKNRLEQEQLSVLGLRFSHDPICTQARFDGLREQLGDHFEAIEIDSGPGNPHGISGKSHSVLTNDLVDEAGHPTRVALDRVLAFFGERLRATD